MLFSISIWRMLCSPYYACFQKTWKSLGYAVYTLGVVLHHSKEIQHRRDLRIMKGSIKVKSNKIMENKIIVIKLGSLIAAGLHQACTFSGSHSYYILLGQIFLDPLLAYYLLCFAFFLKIYLFTLTSCFYLPSWSSRGSIGRVSR